MEPQGTTRHTVRLEDAAAIRYLPELSVHLVVTSPPYPMIEMWDTVFALQDSSIEPALTDGAPDRAFEAMHQLLDRTWGELARVVCPGGIVCVNIGDAARTIGSHFRLFPNHARVIAAFLRLGFHNLPNIIWRKPTNAPNKFMGSGMLPPGAYATLEHEYILIFRRGEKREFATAEEKARRAESAFFWEERNQWYSDVWFDLTGTAQALEAHGSRNRSGAFPLELAWRLINMFSIKGDTVLDPYLGTGTTALAAIISERNSIGFELDAALRTVIRRRIESAAPMSMRLTGERIERHRAFAAQREAEGKTLPYRLAHHPLPCVSRQETGIILRQVDALEWIDEAACRAIYRPFEG